ncbi:hypothetical protein BKK79_07910 [Cupriavidus sp. USMAA2-4]|uniref:hypothetical protein n=1 Tax=unclassified Cupriavidus TaxID=2640874 RepID=UPI0008A6DA6F|nr:MULTISPECIES: hypothetical protein [unclassified Cupriavidus]AOY91731.1 hypothetical protein BKK79_07910 [Cupriavidus sp. USMAA2-4]AOY98711.1 hypothetical protein BKK81_05010 [Cupriavidus sp. USMAHM13]
MPAGRAAHRPVRRHVGLLPRLATLLTPLALALPMAGALLPLSTARAQPARVIPADAAAAKLVLAAPTSTGPQTAALDGRTVGVAPGLRLFGPDNQLLTVTAVAGQTLRVRYKLDLYGQLLTAWVLTEPERKALLQAN